MFCPRVCFSGLVLRTLRLVELLLLRKLIELLLLLLELELVGLLLALQLFEILLQSVILLGASSS